MIGQKELVSYFNNLSSLPNFIILISDTSGAGRRTLLKELAQKRNYQYVEIDNKKEVIENITTLNVGMKVKTMYVFDLSSISVGAISSLLKVCEETNENIIMVGIALKGDVIPTAILSRANVFTLSSYSKEEKELFFKSVDIPFSDLSLSFGNIIKLVNLRDNGDEMIELVDNVVKYLNTICIDKSNFNSLSLFSAYSKIEKMGENVKDNLYIFLYLLLGNDKYKSFLRNYNFMSINKGFTNMLRTLNKNTPKYVFYSNVLEMERTL